MKTNIFSVIACAFLLATPLVCYGETAQECASNCVETCAAAHRGDTPGYTACLNNCLKGCYDKPSPIPKPPNPQPAPKKSENSNFILYAEANKEDTLCCKNTRGEVVGYCDSKYPIFKDVDGGKCYKTGYACQKAGIGFCYSCTRCE